MDLFGAAVVARAILALLPAMFLLGAATPSPSPSPSPLPNVYRVVALAVSAERLVVAGGGVLSIASGCDCESAVAGRAVAIAFDEDFAVTSLHVITKDTPLRAASAIPARAYLFPVISSTKGDPNNPVTVTITVTVPAQTPAGDDVYISTERSNWNPSEIRMNRVDALHWTLSLTVPRGAHLAYRFTRGSFATTERNDARQLPPAHTLVAEPETHAAVTVPGWADVN